MTNKSKWSGLCPAGKHGLDYRGQPCDLCQQEKAQNEKNVQAETAYHLARRYKEQADSIAREIEYWGQYLPEKHRERLSMIRSSFETMFYEAKRLVANAEVKYEGDRDQIMLWLKILDQL